MKTALILGISGQDCAHLASPLLEKGYTVSGGSRDAQITSFGNLPDGRANPAKARTVLGWKAQHAMPDVVRLMVEDEIRSRGV